MTIESDEVMVDVALATKIAQRHRNDDVRTLGRLTRALREKNSGLTREDIARKGRLPKAWVFSLENELLGERDLSRSRMERLGQALLGMPRLRAGLVLADASFTLIGYDQLPQRAHPSRQGRVSR